MTVVVPQFNSLTIEQITEAFASQVVSTATVNITAVIRENLRMWESKLFPVIAAYEISKYEVVADILIEAGCRSAGMSEAERYAFVNVVAKAVRRIKVQQGELSATQKRAAARSAIPAELLRPQTVSKAAPGGNPLPAVAPQSLLPVSVPMGAVVVPVDMAASVSLVAAVQPSWPFSFKTALNRLRSEPPGSAWNAEDDLLHAALLALCAERGASSIKDLTHYLQSNEQSKRDCYVQFLAKIDRTKKVLQ